MHDVCPKCESGRKLGLRKWNKLRQNEFLPALEALRDYPENRKNAEQVLDLAPLVATREEVQEMVILLGPSCTSDAGKMAELGWALGHRNLRSEAVKLLDYSLQIEEKPEVLNYRNLLDSSPPAAPRPPRFLLQVLPVLIVPLLALTGAVLFLSQTVGAKPKHVYLVNGLWQEYEVEVNGIPYRVRPQSHKAVEVDYGPIRVNPVSDAALNVPSYTTEIEASFFQRMGGGPVLVLNPDRAAFLIWERWVYAENPESVRDDEVKWEVHVGEPHYHLGKIDHPFHNPPDEIELSGSRGYRTHLSTLRTENAMELVQNLLHNDQGERTLEVILHVLTADPSQTDLLPYYTSWAPLEEQETFLSSRLSDRPIRLQWHRAYQEWVEEFYPDTVPARAYRQWLREEPDNLGLHYLLGRVVEDSAESVALFEASTESDNPEVAGHGYNALAFHYVEAGDFHKARELIEKARDLQPDNQSFMLLETELRWATRAYSELLESYSRESRIYPEDRDLVDEIVLVSTVMGQPEKADPFIEQDIEAYGSGQDMGSLNEGQLRKYYQGLRHLSAGDTQAYIRALRELHVPNSTFLAELFEGNLEQADALLSDLDLNTQADVWLAMYIAASLHNTTTLADDYLQEALSILQEGSAAEQKRAAWFVQGASSPKRADVHDVEIWPSQKRLVFTALGYRHPEQRQMWHEQAKLFNYYPGYPNPLLNQVLD